MVRLMGWHWVLPAQWLDAIWLPKASNDVSGGQACAAGKSMGKQAMCLCFWKCRRFKPAKTPALQPGADFALGPGYSNSSGPQEAPFRNGF